MPIHQKIQKSSKHKKYLRFLKALENSKDKVGLKEIKPVFCSFPVWYPNHYCFWPSHK